MTNRLTFNLSPIIHFYSFDNTASTMPGKRITEERKQQITADFFRQEPYAHIREVRGISRDSLKRMARCLRTYGTTHRPRNPPTKPIGFPRLFDDKMMDVCNLFDRSYEGRLGVQQEMAYRNTAKTQLALKETIPINNTDKHRTSKPSSKTTLSQP